MEDDDYGGRPLSNADFRKLLETPRPGARKEQGEKKKRPKPQKPHRPKPAAEGAEEEQGYRDRAAERRKGITVDFEAIPEDLANILEGGQAGLSKLSYEESKFLGGDVAHTHLVKGLDFALLQKIRAEQADKKGGEKEDSDEEEEEQAPAAQQQQRQGPRFATPLGRSVYAFFFDPKQRRSRADVAEMFLPRRSAFVFELGDPYAPDVPTLLRRSKEDCPKVQETLLGAVDSSVLERMAKIMSYMSLAGGGKKKMKKKDKMQLLQGIQPRAGIGEQAQQGAPGSATNGAAAPGPASLAAATRREGGGGAAAVPSGVAAGSEEDEDIFADAGTDYVVERKKGADAGAAPAGGGAARYFERPENMSDLPPLPAEGPPPPPPLPPGGDDMELEELGPAPPPPPQDAEAGPARPPAGFDYGTYPEVDAYGAYPNTDAAYAGAATAGAAAQPGGGGGLSQEEKAAGLGSVFKRDDATLRRRAAANDGDDAYAECYPSYYSYAGTVVDSDEEDGGKGPRGQEPQGLSRFDFGSEEEYKAYLAANPKRAAAAGGGGKGDTRKGQREARKRDVQQQQKLNTQLGKIQRIMEEKGHDHANAFKKGGGDGGTGAEAGEPAMITKKRRI